jgi:hypothetical protein
VHFWNGLHRARRLQERSVLKSFDPLGPFSSISPGFYSWAVEDLFVVVVVVVVVVCCLLLLLFGLFNLRDEEDEMFALGGWCDYKKDD